MHKIFVKSYRLWSIIPLACLALCLGCSAQPAATAPIVENAGSDEPFEYAQVELSDPKFNVDESGICWFEVKYKFVKGKIGENYLLNLNFPGTKNACIKQMNGWQLNGPEGVIKDGIQLQEPDFSEYEFVFSEAEVPMEGYTKISNVLTGTYVKP
jgi:hypothetical protein